MEVQNIKKVENCISGNNVFDALLDNKITRDFIAYLGKLGKLAYHPTSGKAYFTIIIRGKYTIKGAQDSKSLRLLMPLENAEQLIDELKDYVLHY